MKRGEEWSKTDVGAGRNRGRKTRRGERNAAGAGQPWRVHATRAGEEDGATWRLLVGRHLDGGAHMPFLNLKERRKDRRTVGEYNIYIYIVAYVCVDIYIYIYIYYSTVLTYRNDVIFNPYILLSSN